MKLIAGSLVTSLFLAVSFCLFFAAKVRSSIVMPPWIPDDVEQNSKPGEAPKFVVTFPAYYRKSKDFIFNLVLFESSEYQLPITFTATLKDIDNNEIAKQDFTQSAYGLQQHAFSNMKSIGHVRYPVVSIKFHGSQLGKYENLEERPDGLAERFVFIQTDKAMYKPSQTVHFRVLALNRELAPITGKVAVTILDAKNNKIRIWVDQTLERGVFGASFTLSDFVNFGDWTVSVSGANMSSPTEKSFTVQQYVLPKYEAKLEFPNGYLQYSRDEEGYTGYVRAKYTFGKPIRGNAIVQLIRGCSHYYPRPYYSDIRGGRPMTVWTPPVLIEKSVVLRGDGSPEDGKFTLEGLNTVLFNTSSPSGAMLRPSCSLAFKVNVTEELTGEVVSPDESSIQLYRDRYTIKVHESVAKTLKAGMPFTMRVQVTRPDGTPVNEQVEVVIVHHSFKQKAYCGMSLGDKPDYYAIKTSDQFGMVTVDVDVPEKTESLIFKAFIRDSAETEICEERTVPKSRSRHAVSIKLNRSFSQTSSIPKIGDSLNIRIRTTFQTDYIYFLVAQNGQPFIYKKLENPTVKSSTGSEFSVDVVLPDEAAPRCAAVAWSVETSFNEVLADAVEFKVDGLVKQQVSAEFTPAVVKPGESTRLTVRTSEAGSTVAMFAVDKSVKLLRSGNDISVDDVIGTVSSHLDDGNSYRPVAPLMWRCWRCGWWPSWVDSSSADQVFRQVGMFIMSNAYTKPKPTIMPRYNYMRPVSMANEWEAMPPMMAMARGDEVNLVLDDVPSTIKYKGAAESPAAPAPVVRMLFPETWFWSTNTSNSNEFSETYKAPDTVTSWVLSAFAVGERNGFGSLQQPVELTVFQPFFVNLDIPYATVIRNEQFAIKAVVFNYQSTPQTIKLTLKKSLSFEISTDGGKTYASDTFLTTVQVPANDGQSVSLWLRPRQLGEISLELEGISVSGESSSDAIQKKITVEPEGETRYANRPIFVRRDHNELPAFETTINVDEMFGSVNKMQVVEGSRYFQLQVIGDLLGPALTQLGGQIRLPTGCGEQTLVILAPNVYIYKYLKSVNELTAELESKTTNFVLQGYQRELTYQRNDGGFSAFGNSDPASSTWLTAFVIRSFNAAAKHLNTPIDETIMERAWKFVKKNTNKDGTFLEPGRVIHLSMKGGATSDFNLAAYIYITHAESADSNNKARLSSLATTRSLLEAKLLESETDPYQLALVAYATSILPEDRQTSSAALDLLMAKALKDGGLSYWNTTGHSSKIETAAYALLALCNHQHLDEATGVARWLMSQRNSLGGFSSTQDTVVGLQALAEFASKLSGVDKNLQVRATMHFADNIAPFIKEFVVLHDNAMLLQSFDLPRNRQSLHRVGVAVTGTGVGLLQLALRYNVVAQKVMDSGDFDIIIVQQFEARRRRSIYPDADETVSLVTCVHAKTSDAKSGMVVAELGIPTGFSADLDETKRSNPITTSSLLKRIELAGDRKLVYYFDSLTSGSEQGNSNKETSTCVTSKMIRKSAVKNVQLPVARVYAYYEPFRAKSVLYKFEGLESSGESSEQTEIKPAVMEIGQDPVSIVEKRTWILDIAHSIFTILASMF